MTSWRASPEHPIYNPDPKPRGCTGLWADVSELGEYATAPNAMDALQASSYILWVLSGRKYGGVCTITETYTCGDCCGQCITQYVEVAPGNVKTICGSCGYSSDQKFLFLRQRPAQALVSMYRDGMQLDVSQYSIYDYSYVGPNDLSGCAGGNCWDACGTEVTYLWGTYPPAIAKMAAIEFASQFVKAVECPGECKLPERVTSVSRQGVSFQIFDPQDFVNEGRTGLYVVDVFLKSVNPDRAQKRARVFSPDMPQAHRKTWPAAGSKAGGW